VIVSPAFPDSGNAADKTPADTIIVMRDFIFSSMIVDEVEHQATPATHNSRNRHYGDGMIPPPAIIDNSGCKQTV
jgi:hypothetical protein